MHDLAPTILAIVLAGLLAACGPLPAHPAPGWNQPSNINGVTGERASGR